jgi:hypothetical protein
MAMRKGGSPHFDLDAIDRITPQMLWMLEGTLLPSLESRSLSIKAVEADIVSVLPAIPTVLRHIEAELHKEIHMSLSWTAIESFFQNLIAKGETDLTKIQGIMSEVFPVVEAAAAAVGGPAADDVVIALNAVSSVTNIVQTVAAPVAAAVAAPNTILVPARILHGSNQVKLDLGKAHPGKAAIMALHRELIPPLRKVA